MRRPFQRPKRPTRPQTKLAKIPAPHPAPAWPSYQGSSQYVGTSSGGVSVWVDPSLGTAAQQNAADLLADADRIVSFNQSIFGTMGDAVDVMVFAKVGATDGTGGADHGGCDFLTGNAIEVCASYGASLRCSALFEAEYSECSMGQDLCGVSTGEALSRWCAMLASGNALADFATAPIWSADGAPNFVDTVDPTDTNPDSIGCGMAFLSWLQAMGYSFCEIAPAMVELGTGGTLAQLYGALTGQEPATAWPQFSQAVASLSSGIQTDDPFAGMNVPSPAPSPGPAPQPSPGPGPVGVSLEDAIAWAAQGLSENWPQSGIEKALAIGAQTRAAAGAITRPYSTVGGLPKPPTTKTGPRPYKG